MNVGFLLHLYQPSTQTENVFKQVCSETYIPLIKLLKNKPHYRISLNVPLSLLEQMDKYGYKDWLKDLKDLYDAERVEIVGSAAYHPLLTKIPEDYIDQEIILNEYGMGYYLGSKQGFEGEDSILVKNLKGFFPPELSINPNVYSKINDLGYEWVLVEKCAIPQGQTLMLGQNVFKYKNNQCLLIVRDDELSNMLSFKRDSLNDDFIDKLHKKAETADSVVISLDAEAFGHHNREGIYLLEDTIDKILHANHTVVTVSDLVSESIHEEIDEIFESNWSESTCVKDQNMYKLWDNSENEIQKSLWYIQENVLKSYQSTNHTINIEGYENISFWVNSQISNLPAPDRLNIELMLLINKSLHSDQFWWASGVEVFDKNLFSPTMINNALNLYKEIAARLDDKDLIYLIDQKSTQISDIINK